MVCDTIIYHPSITRLIKFLDSSASREKVLRLLQYLCRFLGVQYKYLLSKQLQVEFATVRKFLRFLKPLNHIQAASKFYDNKIAPDELLRWCNIIKNLAYAGYLALDQISLLRILKLIPVNPLTSKKIPRWTNWCWLAGLVAGLTMDIAKIRLCQKKIHSLINEDGGDEKKLLQKTYNERFGALRRLVWDGIDTFVVLNNLKFLQSQDSSVALAGMTTSLLGMQDLWNSV